MGAALLRQGALQLSTVRCSSVRCSVAQASTYGVGSSVGCCIAQNCSIAWLRCGVALAVDNSILYSSASLNSGPAEISGVRFRSLDVA